MAKLERIYTVPLGEAYSAVRRKRVPRAVKILRAFIARHMKAEGEKILLSQALNASLWVKSIEKPPRRVKVRLIKEEEAIRAYLADEKIEEPKKAEKKEEKAAEKKPEAKKEEKPPAKAELKKEEKPAASPAPQGAKPPAGNRVPAPGPQAAAPQGRPPATAAKEAGTKKETR